MHDWQSLSHVRWDCKYDVVIVPKYRRRLLYGKFRSDVGRILRDLCRQKGVEVLEGTLRPDHVHRCLQIAPKFSLAFVIGFLKGSAVRIHRELMSAHRVKGMHCVSTVGLDELTVRKYIRHQEEEEKRQLDLELEQTTTSR